MGNNEEEGRREEREERREGAHTCIVSKSRGQ